MLRMFMLSMFNAISERMSYQDETLQTGNGEDVLDVQENVEQTGARVDSNNIIS